MHEEIEKQELKEMSRSKMEHHYQNGTEGVIAKIYNSARAIFITYNSNIDNTVEIIKGFMPNANVITYPDYDVLPFERVSPSSNIINARLSTLSQLSEDINSYILVTSPQALKRKIIPKSVLKRNYLNLMVEANFNRQAFIEKLINLGFSRLINACNAGEFAVRGSVIDVVIGSGVAGYRIDFYGDHIESIRLFDPIHQHSLERVNNIYIHACQEVIIDDKILNNFTNLLRTTYGLKSNSLIEAFANHRKIQGQENLLPFFYGELETLFDYIAPDTQFFYQYDIAAHCSQLDEKLKELYNQRVEFKIKAEEAFFPTPNIDLLYLDEVALTNKLNAFYSIKLNPFAEIKFFSAVPNYHILSKSSATSSISLFKDDISKFKSIHNIITCYSIGSKQRLKNMFNEYEINCQDIKYIDEIYKMNTKIVGLICMPLQEGFNYKIDGKNINIISEQELLGVKFRNKIKERNYSNNVFTELSSFQEGELVVHIQHGIGRFEGLQSIAVNGITHDFVKLIYAEGDKFYLPVENLELITRFGSADHTALDKLGATNWQLRKAKLKNRIKIAAEALLKIAAERALITAVSLSANPDIYDQFCAGFPYVETEGQQQAIEDVINDLAQGKPMDRLVCGDVGFGKTEVALRAALVAIANPIPVQVAILVPTTLLSRQHSETFNKRFKDLPVRIAQLSKFTQRSAVKQIKQDLENGKIDIIIGTHALLAKDIKFKNLGLIIIDEEQHFGVGQKERLKEIKSHSHVLTLSATPIPRTLHLSLTGIKDLSIIATPPSDRLPIKTYVTPMDQLTIREAILREYYRGGRIFYVTPRISYLGSIVNMLKEIVPEVKAHQAHGALSAAELDKIMNNFYDGKFSILVSTTIIESGLDIPNANTIIIDRAHMFGLAQLYQIRGRVGRSNVQSFAYLTYPPTLRLTDLAEKRLQILSSFENLGAGFSVASHDMDLRGYGNLVGEEQSGQVKEVGVELYQHMLEEAIQNLKNNQENINPDDQASDIWSPQLNLKISIQIPNEYIPDASLRLSLYRRVASIDSVEALEEFAIELIDRFGNLPIETEHLITTVKFKQQAKEAYIDKLDVGDKGILVTFRNNKPRYPNSVMKFINNNVGTVKLRDGGKLLIVKELKTEFEIIDCVRQILESLCKEIDV